MIPSCPSHPFVELCFQLFLFVFFKYSHTNDDILSEYLPRTRAKNALR